MKTFAALLLIASTYAWDATNAYDTDGAHIKGAAYAPHAARVVRTYATGHHGTRTYGHHGHGTRTYGGHGTHYGGHHGYTGSHTHTTTTPVRGYVEKEITVPRVVTEQVTETKYVDESFTESNDSGDGYDSDERIYVDSVSSESSSDDYCNTWNHCYSSSSHSSSDCGWYGHGHGYCNTTSSASSVCDTWDPNCSATDTSVSSYIITSDSSDDEMVRQVPVDVTRDVHRVVHDKKTIKVPTVTYKTSTVRHGNHHGHGYNHHNNHYGHSGHRYATGYGHHNGQTVVGRHGHG